MKCLKCGFESQAGMRFCGRCGNQLALPCPNCNYANPPEYLFCGMCGNPLPSEGETLQTANGTLLANKTKVKEDSRKPDSTSVRVEGERRVATVVMADVRHSTDLLDEIGTEAWVEIMNSIFKLMNTEIYRFGGHVDQFRGDGVVAFFGTQVAHEDDPERAVLSSLAMQQAISNYSQRLTDQEGIEVKLRVGINTGDVIVASIGDSEQHQEDTAMGEAVAIAARMESAAEPGTVLVSENTYRLIMNRFHWQPMGETIIKGFKQPMSVYRPLSPRFDFESAQDLQAYSMPISMTGRVQEFKQLRTQIENLQAGKGGILLIEGEKGVGKSLLVTQVRHHFSRQAGNQIETRARKSSTALPIEMESVEITWLKGVCRSYDQTWPFSAWLDVLYQWLGVQPDKPVEEKRDRLRYLSLVLWGDAQERYYPYLATFLSIPLEDAGAERVRYLDAEGLRKQLFITIRSWIESLSRRGPLVVSFVDMQWIDHASLELLKYCLPLCDSRPLVWLGIYRPDRMSPAWEFKQHVEREYPHRLTLVEMGSLNERDSRELIQQLVGPLALSEKTTSMIVAKSEGNPYFMREILTSLIAQDVLKQDAETGFLTETKPVTSLELPDNLQSLLLERLDRLSPEENQVLKAASVMGINFWYEVLKELTPEISLLDNHLTSLQRRGLIQEQNQITGLGMEYGFNSSLVRDVVYESMLEHQREDYHRKVAVFLEDCACIEQWLQHSSLIAYHYHYANDPKKELFYSLKAAEQARKLYANTEAYKHLTRALELLDEMENNLVISENYEVILTHKFEALSDRSQVNLLIGQPEEAAQDAHQLLVLADLLADDPYWRVDAILRQSEVNNPDNLDALEKGLAIIKEAIEISRKLEDKNRELQCLMRMAYLQSLKREPVWKITAENALRMAEELGDNRSQVLLLLWFASAYGIDDLETNLIYLESAIPIIELLDDKMIEMQLLRAFAEQYERNGDYYRQLTEFEQKRLQLSREIGSRVVEGDALMYCGQVQALYLGDYEGGLTRLREALRLYESTPARLFPLLRMAQTFTILGRYKDAQDALDIAQPLIQRDVTDLGRAGYWLVKTILANNKKGKKNLNQVIELHKQISQLVNEKLVSRQYMMASACEATLAHLTLSSHQRDAAECQKNKEQALQASKLALQIYEQFGFVQIIECSSQEILFRHSLALKANQDLLEASSYLEKAYAEMMRKYDLIPPYSPYRKSYLEEIDLHKRIRDEYIAEQPVNQQSGQALAIRKQQ